MNQANTETPKLFNRYFFIVAFTNLSLSLMMQMYNSIITLHLDSLGHSASRSGSIIALGAIAATVYRFFGGKLTDKGGRRQLIAIGCILFGAGSFAAGLITSLVPFYIIRLIQMLGYSMASTAASIAIVEVLPRARISEGIGYYGLAVALAQAVGPPVALSLFWMPAGFRTVMTYIFVIGAISFIITLICLNYEKSALKREAAQQQPSDGVEYQGVWKYLEAKAVPAAVCNLFNTCAVSVIFVFLTLYATKAGIANVGLFFTISVVFMVAARLFAGKLSDRKGTLSALLPGLTSTALAFLLLSASASNHTLYYIAGAFYGLGSGMILPSLNAEAVKNAPPSRISAASSTFLLPMDIAFMFGSLFWGTLIDYVSFQTIFLIAAGLTVVTFILASILFKKKKTVGLPAIEADANT